MTASILPQEASVQSVDAALVASILAGETQAFERLMRIHNRRLFRAARSILHDDDEAEDAVQEGYIRAFGALAGFRGEARLSTWLTRIVVNQALQRQRQRHLPMTVDGGCDEPIVRTGDTLPETPESEAMRSELRRLVEASIDGLPSSYRSVFMLRAVEGLSVEETSASLGISEASTKIRFLRARQQLRQALGRRLGPLLEDVFTFAGGRCDRIVARVHARLGLAGPRVPVSGEFPFYP